MKSWMDGWVTEKWALISERFRPPNWHSFNRTNGFSINSYIIHYYYLFSSSRQALKHTMKKTLSIYIKDFYIQKIHNYSILNWSTNVSIKKQICVVHHVAKERKEKKIMVRPIFRCDARMPPIFFSFFLSFFGKHENTSAYKMIYFFYIRCTQKKRRLIVFALRPRAS